MEANFLTGLRYLSRYTVTVCPYRSSSAPIRCVYARYSSESLVGRGPMLVTDRNVLPQTVV